jgi:rhodanese-related sulfurtransferase
VEEAIKTPACDHSDCKKRGKMKINDFVSIILTIFLIPMMANLSKGSEKVVFHEIPRISAEEMKKMIDTGADFVRVDVRDGASYAAGHIKGAINIYYNSTADPMDRQMMLLALPMDKLIVTYCDCSDDASSATIAEELYKLGYDRDKVKVLSGGSLRWVEIKYPMVGSK